MTLKRWLIALGAFVLAYNLATITHEYGHALNLAATAGQVRHITVSPLGWSYCYYRTVHEHRAVAWGGFLWATIIPSLLFLVLWAIKSRLSFWAAIFAATALASEGVYMLTGVLFETGDAHRLITLGLPKAVLIVLGGVLVAVSVVLALPVGALIGVGRGRSRFRQTALVIGTPILAYLAIIAAYSMCAYPKERVMWAGSVGLGCGIALAVAALAHLAAPLFSGPESKARQAPVNWPAAIIGLAVPACVVIGEVFALFPLFANE